DLAAPGAEGLSHGEVIEISLGHVRQFLRQRRALGARYLTSRDQAPRQTAAALIRPKAASARPSAMKTPVRSPPRRSASHPPPAASASLAKLASNGQRTRPAPWDAQ